MAAWYALVLHLAVWLVLLCAIFIPLESLAGIRRQAVWRRQFGVDLGYYALNSIMMGFLMGVPIVLAGAMIHRLIPSDVLWHIAQLPAGVRLVLSLLVGEVFFYWAHRFTHSNHFLWRFHAIHHSATEIDFLTNTRAHPVDMAFTRICGFIPVLALGLTGGPGVSALLLVLGTLWGFFIHANVRLRFGPLEHIIATPFFHHWHHANGVERNGNYAAMLAFVDHLFGTYVSRRDWPQAYGIDEVVPATLGEQLVMPLMPPAPRPHPAQRR